MTPYEMGYLQAIADADRALRARGDDLGVRGDRKVVLALANIDYHPEYAIPYPDWSKAKVPEPESNPPTANL
jgi:hypothetical protein